MADEKNDEERRKILDDIKSKIGLYEQETDLEKAQGLWREIKSSIEYIRKYQGFGFMVTGQATRAKMAKLKEFAQRCPTNDLEFRTEEGSFCKLSADLEDFNACEHQSESFGMGFREENYCKYCEYNKNGT